MKKRNLKTAFVLNDVTSIANEQMNDIFKPWYPKSVYEWKHKQKSSNVWQTAASK